MVSIPASVICEFYRIFPSAPAPRRADRSADGMLSVRGYRFCEALASASAYGWYIYPPLNFSLVWDGVEIAWTYENAETWYPLRAAQFPGFREMFEQIAPEHVREMAPAFLTTAREPGVVQIWSGYLTRTPPNWSLLCRGPVNIPRTQGIEYFEGIVETANWFGPLFTNVRLTHTNSPVEFHTRYPLFQVQPLLRECYTDLSMEILNSKSMSELDWQQFERTMRPNTNQNRALGHYAVEARKSVRRVRSGESSP